MNKREILSEEAENLLSEIIANEKSDDYWRLRFENLNNRDDAILRESFGELQKNNVISVLWADDHPCIIQILGDGYLYQERKEKLAKSQSAGSAPKDENLPKSYDVFLSHANKDKLEIVDNLNNSLKKLGIKIFYDKESLEWGDDWKSCILNGVEQAEFAIIVISQNFFGREWTERELTEFLNRQDKSGQKLILPIVHNISNEDLSIKYPSVAEIQPLDSRDYSCDQIALLFAGQLIQRLKLKNR